MGIDSFSLRRGKLFRTGRGGNNRFPFRPINDELLRLELTELRELGADLKLTGFDATELACIMLGKDVEFKEYDESAADDVQLLTCPKCGHTFPR
jgi:hypothetical protein